MEGYLKIYLPKTDEQINEIWNESIVVLDANILLNLYRYTKSTREEFLEILNGIRNKTWIPHQVAIEYLTNRTNVILDQERDFKDQSEAINEGKKVAVEKIKEKLTSIKKPFRKIDLDEIKDRIDVFFEKLIKDVVVNNENTVNFNDDDIILRNFKRIFKGRIGPSYGVDELEEIYTNGEKRYQENQPPGYEDSKDKQKEYRLYKDTTIKSEYGDLIVWKQIIDKAKEDNKPVIFITDDRKPDWWKEVRGQIKGPREELLNEFFHETKNELLMYNTESFLRTANKILDITIHQDTLREVHDYAEIRRRLDRMRLSKSNERKFKESREYKNSLYKKNIPKYRKELLLLNERIEATQRKLKSMEYDLISLSLNPYNRDEYEIMINELKETLHSMNVEKKWLEERSLKYHIDSERILAENNKFN